MFEIHEDRSVDRNCGECNACCIAPRIHALKKSAHQKCVHCTLGQGCDIYEHRPDVCSTFLCLWKHSDGSMQRPDQSGIIQLLKLMSGGLRMTIWECRSGALLEDGVRDRIAELLADGVVVTYVPMNGTGITYVPTNRTDEQLLWYMTFSDRADTVHVSASEFQRRPAA